MLRPLSSAAAVALAFAEAVEAVSDVEPVRAYACCCCHPPRSALAEHGMTHHTELAVAATTRIESRALAHGLASLFGPQIRGSS